MLVYAEIFLVFKPTYIIYVKVNTDWLGGWQGTKSLELKTKQINTFKIYSSVCGHFGRNKFISILDFLHNC